MLGLSSREPAAPQQQVVNLLRTRPFRARPAAGQAGSALPGKVPGQAGSAPSDVLTIHVVRPGGHHYYVDDLVPGRAEGSGVAGESPGTWFGAGLSDLGVGGTVVSPVFGEVLEGRDPGSGRSLRTSMGTRGVSGFDLTFCAPKSVSLLHLLAPGELAAQVGRGHLAAVAEAAGYLQRAGLGVRRTRAGQVTQLPTTGLVAGEFVHRTSRALDPHLHTHLVVANVARGVDGRWSTLDGRRMFSHAHATRAIYHARLRMELRDRLGAAWDVPRSGMGDVVGVDPTLRRLFSQRSAAMDEYLAGRVAKRNGPGRTRGAFHATRPDKDRTCTVDSLMGEWKQRAADYGFDLGDLTRVVGRGRSVEPAGIDPDRVRSGLEELSGRRRTLAHRDVVAVLAAASPQGTRSEVIESAATNVVQAAGAPLSRSASSAVPVGRRSGTFEPRWATLDVVRVAGTASVELVDPVIDRGRSGPDRDTAGVRPPDLVRSPFDVQLGR